MLNRTLHFFVVTVCCLLASVSFAEVSDANLERLMALSGLTKQVTQFPDMIVAGMAQARQQNPNVSEQAYRALATSAKRAIQPGDILADIKSTLKKSLTEQEVGQLLDWFESPTGKAVTKVEEDASTPVAYQNMMKQMPELLGKKDLLAYAKRIDALTGTTDMALHMQEYTQIAIYSGMMAELHPKAPLNIAPLRAQMDAHLAQTRAATEKMIDISYIYAYQHLSPEQRAAYEAFNKTPAAKKFNATAGTSMQEGMETAVSKWAGDLARNFRHMDTKQ